MANNIEFKYVDSNSDPICGLTINYSVRVIAVLANNKSEEPIYRGSVYTSNVILDGTDDTDSDGLITVDVTNVFSDDEFLSIFNKFTNAPGYNVSIEVLLISEQEEIGGVSYIAQKDIPTMLSAYNVYYDKGSDEYVYNDLDYWDVYDSFMVDEIVIDKEILEATQSKKLQAQRSYLESLEDFQGEILSQASLQIPILNEYDPINITQIITRCLELNVGTIENALSYTTDAGLIAETNRLNKIKTLVGQISNLYPTITIEDGEGLPYQNVGVIPDIFRGFGFYQDGGEMYAQAYIFGENKGKDCFGVKQPILPVSFDVNGTVIFNSDLGFDEKYTYINTNLTQAFIEKNVTLVPGDIVTMSVFLDCQYYYSKLIIKN